MASSMLPNLLECTPPPKAKAEVSSPEKERRQSEADSPISAKFANEVPGDRLGSESGSDADPAPPMQLHDFSQVALKGATLVADWMEDDGKSDDEASGEDDNGVVTFAMNDSDSDSCSDDDMELEDAYNFDHERLAGLISSGATDEELIQAAQEGMAKAFEDRMQHIGFYEVIEEGSEEDASGKATPTDTSPPQVAAKTEEMTTGEDASASAVMNEEKPMPTSAEAEKEEKKKGEEAAQASTDIETKKKATAASKRLFGRALMGLGGPARRSGNGSGSGSLGSKSKEDDEPERRRLGNLSREMTPPEAQSPEFVSTPKASGNISPSDLSRRMEASAASGGRRATIATGGPGGRRVSAAPAGKRFSTRRNSVQSAMDNQMATVRRQSLAAARRATMAAASSTLAGTGSAANIEELKLAARRARMSISKVGDILEDADLDESDDEKAMEQMKRVQNCVAEASRRHNKIIEEATAAMNLASDDVEEGDKKQKNAEAEAETSPTTPDEEKKTEELQASEEEPKKLESEGEGKEKKTAEVEKKDVVVSDLWASAAEFKPPTLSANAAEFKPAVDTSVQDRIQAALKAAHDRKLGKKTVAPGSLQQTSQGTYQLSVQDRIQQAAREARERRLGGNSDDVQARIQQATATAHSMRGAQAMGSPSMASPVRQGFGQQQGWESQPQWSQPYDGTAGGDATWGSAANMGWGSQPDQSQWGQQGAWNGMQGGADTTGNMYGGGMGSGMNQWGAADNSQWGASQWDASQSQQQQQQQQQQQWGGNYGY